MQVGWIEYTKVSKIVFDIKKTAICPTTNVAIVCKRYISYNSDQINSIV